jgi:hypothetical protein
MDDTFSKGIMHVFGQDAWHQEVVIAGSRERLLALRQAIDDALEHKFGACTSYVNDGEGYATIVCIPSDVELEALGVPYSADYALERRDNSLIPSDIEGYVDFMHTLNTRSEA